MTATHPDYELDWYKGMFIILTHAPVLFGMAITWFHWQKHKKTGRYEFRPYIITFTIVMLCGLVSVIYHWCLAGFGCIESVLHLQRSDHTTVYIAMFWVFLTVLMLNIHILVSQLMIVTGFYIVFAPALVDTMLFPIALGLYALSVLTVVVCVFRLPLQHYDISLSVVFVCNFGVGLVFQYSVDSVYHPWYWFLHGIWHLLSFTALDIALLIRRGFSVPRLLGIPPYWKALKDEGRELEAGLIDYLRFLEHHLLPDLEPRWEAGSDIESYGWA